MTNFTFTLTGQIRGGKNNVLRTRTGRCYPNPSFTAWRKAALLQLKPQLTGQTLPIQRPITLIVDYVPEDHRRRDLPALLDSLGHLFEKAGLLVDDSQIKNVNWKHFEPDKQHAGARITVLA